MKKFGGNFETTYDEIYWGLKIAIRKSANKRGWK